MTCPRCIPMYATSEAQLANRQKNMARVPDATPFPCPGCGSADWATSREMIREEPRWWQSGHPRAFHRLRDANVIVAALCAGLAFGEHYTHGLTWTVTVDLFFAGANGALALGTTMLIKANDKSRRLEAALEELHQLNHALIENRVKMHIAGIAPDDDEPPLAPGLH